MIRSLLLLLALLASPLSAGDGPATAAEAAPAAHSAAKPKVAFIPIDGEIDERHAGQFKRALTAALVGKPEFIVVHITTDGGLVDSAEEMVRAELIAGNQGTKLVIFIDNRAYSAGAMISYGCSRIYMTSNALIGDIGVIFINQVEGKVEYAPEKFETPVRSLLRDCGQHNGWSQAKLQKMTARNQDLWEITLDGVVTWVIEDDLSRFLAGHPGLTVKDGVMQRGEERIGFVALGKDRLLTYTASEAVAAGMATAVVKDVDEVYRALGVTAAEVKRFEPSPQELLAEKLSGWAPLLAALAVLFLIMEFKVPAGGLWLIGAAVCGCAFLAMQYWLQLAGAPEIVLIVLGIAAIVAEVFIVATAGMLGLAGLLMVATGLVLAFMPDGIQFQPSAAGWGDALGSAMLQSMTALLFITAGVVIAISTIQRTRAMRVLASRTAIDGTSAGAIEASAVALVGRRGRARSELRPSGFITIDGREVAAVTEHGVMVAAGAEVEIVESRFGELVVRPVQGQGS